MLIYIDAGHGLYTAGKRCLKSIDPNETREWTLNSRIAGKVQQLLRDYDCDTARADDVTGQTDVALEERVRATNDAGADVYLSIHHNAGINGGDGGGIVVFRAEGCSATSKALQQAVYEKTVERTGLKGNRADPMAVQSFYVIAHTDMPAVLGEFGFMDSTADTPMILTEEFADQVAAGIVDALVQVLGLQKTEPQVQECEYACTNGVHIVSIPAAQFRVCMVDAPKDDLPADCANAGFFATYHEQGDEFTLPVAHLICDYDAASQWTKKYCQERGSFDGEKFLFDSAGWSYQNPFCGKAVSTLIVREGKAEVVESVTLPEADYAVSGVPIIRAGRAADWEADALPQGWEASNVRPTWHTFVGLNGDGRVYVMGWKSESTNLVSSGEAYQLFSALGFTDVLKLDGGGSFCFSARGEGDRTQENRRINTVIPFFFPQTEDGEQKEEGQTGVQPEEDEGYEQWKAYLTRYREELAAQAASMPELVEAARSLGITDGSRPRDLMTREEGAVMARAAALARLN